MSIRFASNIFWYLIPTLLSLIVLGFGYVVLADYQEAIGYGEEETSHFFIGTVGSGLAGGDISKGVSVGACICGTFGPTGNACVEVGGAEVFLNDAIGDNFSYEFVGNLSAPPGGTDTIDVVYEMDIDSTFRAFFGGGTFGWLSAYPNIGLLIPESEVPQGVTIDDIVPQPCDWVDDGQTPTTATCTATVMASVDASVAPGTYNIATHADYHISGNDQTCCGKNLALVVTGGPPPPPPPPPPPDPVTGEITANGVDDFIRVSYESDVIVEWTSENASSCLIPETGWTGKNGIRTVNDITSNKTYTLRCDGDVVDSVTVQVALDVSLSADGQDNNLNLLIPPGGSETPTLSWEIAGGSNQYICQQNAAPVDFNWQSGGVSVPSGQMGQTGSSQTITYTQTTQDRTYTLICWQQDDSSNFGSDTVNINVTQTGGNINDAVCESLFPPLAPVETGESFVVPTTFANLGTQEWEQGTHKIISKNPTGNTTWGLSEMALPQASVSPGENATFFIGATAPAVAGTYPFQWRMVDEEEGEFGSRCQTNIIVEDSSVPPPPTPAPTVTLIASPPQVPSGGISQLQWFTTNASSCSAFGDWSGSKTIPSGVETQSNITSDKFYLLQCWGPGGSGVDDASVTLIAPACTGQCCNFTDDDGDGLIDVNDPGCKNNPDHPTEGVCGDGICEPGNNSNENPITCPIDCRVVGEEEQ